MREVLSTMPGNLTTQPQQHCGFVAALPRIRSTPTDININVLRGKNACTYHISWSGIYNALFAIRNALFCLESAVSVVSDV